MDGECKGFVETITNGVNVIAPERTVCLSKPKN